MSEASIVPQYDGLPCEISTEGCNDGRGYRSIYTGMDPVTGNSRYVKAHRVACEATNGPSPSDKPMACHTCDTPACVRPSHLFWGSRADNMQDMWDKGRHSTANLARGESHHNHGVTEGQVKLIRVRKAQGATYTQLEQEFNMKRCGLWKIVHKVTWKEVE